MLVPSIDLMKGRVVQLVGGERLELEAGDAEPWARKFARAGEIAVIDLDAARGEGENRDLVLRLARDYPIRAGGGIRDYETAKAYLDAGARKIILGTAADPALLLRLPRDRIIVALDSREGKVLAKGWREGTGLRVEERLKELAPYAGGFLLTQVEREGRLCGIDFGSAERLSGLAGGLGWEIRLTFAGGIAEAEEIRRLDGLGADAQVGMALYTGKLALGSAFTAPLVSDRPDGLWPVVVSDEAGITLGLAWADAESVSASLETGKGVYTSRKRGLWEKGSRSGNSQELIRAELDCDRDALRYVVRQTGVFCHRGTRSCFGQDWGLSALERTVAARQASAPEGSYTRRLFGEPGLLAAKLREEASELAEASGPERASEEAADLLYFLLVKLRAEGASLEDAARVLDRRALKISRRPGDAKEAYLEGGARWLGIH